MMKCCKCGQPVTITSTDANFTDMYCQKCFDDGIRRFLRLDTTCDVAVINESKERNDASGEETDSGR